MFSKELAGYTVHELYYDELLRFFIHATHDVHEAQDLVQETFERVLARMSNGESIQNARALLYETGRNLLIDRHRRAQHRMHDGENALDNVAAPATTHPDVMYAGRERVGLLMTAIESLPPRCREAFVRHRIDGLSQAEVAREMQISLNMVERHIMLAVATCRKALGEERRRAAASSADSEPGSPSSH